MKKSLLTLVCVLSLPVFVWAANGKVMIKGTALDSKITGEVTLVEENGGIMLEAIVANVTPGQHGFHIHENGSCDDMGKAAGSHYNPDGVSHGYMPKDGSMNAHAGDMGNIEVGEDGVGTLKVFMPGLTLKGGRYEVVGRSIILHEKADDFSQPLGNAGGRIGCGIIEYVKD